jgi:hypothetical protein
MTPEEEEPLHTPIANGHTQNLWQGWAYPPQADQVLFSVFAGGLTFAAVKDIVGYSTLTASRAGIGVGWLVFGGHRMVLKGAYEQLTHEFSAYNEASESPDAKVAVYDAFSQDYDF